MGNGQHSCKTLFMGKSISEAFRAAIYAKAEQLADDAVMLYEQGAVTETVEEQIQLALDVLFEEINKEEVNYVYKKTPLQ